MKAIRSFVALFAITSGMLFADGYPFDPTTQQVTCDTLRIRISESQVEGLSATGQITLTDSQLSSVRRFYPKAINIQSVISATFNDNNEDLTAEDVYVFWVAAAEIAITLNPIVIANEELRRSALADETAPQSADIRIAPNGQIYIAGKRASMKGAIELILERSKRPDERHVAICVAPPFHSPLSNHKDTEGQYQEAIFLEKIVADAFQALVKHGESQNIAVNKCW